MLTLSEKEEFLEELRSLVESDFTGVDVCSFIRDHQLAQYLLGECRCCDYSSQINYINNHDDIEIQNILDTPHMEYYDSDYGSFDPLTDLRVSKAYDDEEGDDSDIITFANLEEHDNVLSHMLWMLNEEDTEIPLEEILKKENLSKLIGGGYDCMAKQIYYFEQIEYGKFIFRHYFKEDDGWDCCDYEMNFMDYKEFAKTYFGDCDNPDFEEDHFYYSMENMYRQYMGPNEQNTPLREAVFNGVEAIDQLKEYTYPHMIHMLGWHNMVLQDQYDEGLNNFMHEVSRNADVWDKLGIDPEMLYALIMTPFLIKKPYKETLLRSMIGAFERIREQNNELNSLRADLNSIKSIIDKNQPN